MFIRSKKWIQNTWHYPWEQVLHSSLARNLYFHAIMIKIETEHIEQLTEVNTENQRPHSNALHLVTLQ